MAHYLTGEALAALTDDELCEQFRLTRPRGETPSLAGNDPGDSAPGPSGPHLQYAEEVSRRNRGGAGLDCG
jgi:hypothetical protein